MQIQTPRRDQRGLRNQQRDPRCEDSGARNNPASTPTSATVAIAEKNRSSARNFRRGCVLAVTVTPPWKKSSNGVYIADRCRTSSRVPAAMCAFVVIL